MGFQGSTENKVYLVDERIQGRNLQILPCQLGFHDKEALMCVKGQETERNLTFLSWRVGFNQNLLLDTMQEIQASLNLPCTQVLFFQ